MAGADTLSVADGEKRKSTPKRVTAFVLDRDHVHASDDGMTVPPLPGLWRNDVAIHPDALGLTLAETRDLIEKLSLPLVETTVTESRAVKAFPTPGYLRETAPNAMGGVAGPGDAPAASADADEVSPENVDVERARLAADETDDAGEDE